MISVYTKNNIDNVSNKIIDKYKNYISNINKGYNYIISTPKHEQYIINLIDKYKEDIEIDTFVCDSMKGRKNWLIVIDGKFTDEEMEFLQYTLVNRLDYNTREYIEDGRMISLDEFLKNEYILK